MCKYLYERYAEIKVRHIEKKLPECQTVPINEDSGILIPSALLYHKKFIKLNGVSKGLFMFALQYLALNDTEYSDNSGFIVPKEIQKYRAFKRLIKEGFVEENQKFGTFLFSDKWDNGSGCKPIVDRYGIYNDKGELKKTNKGE